MMGAPVAGLGVAATRDLRSSSRPDCPKSKLCHWLLLLLLLLVVLIRALGVDRTEAAKTKTEEEEKKEAEEAGRRVTVIVTFACHCQVVLLKWSC